MALSKRSTLWRWISLSGVQGIAPVPFVLHLGTLQVPWMGLGLGEAPFRARKRMIQGHQSLYIAQTFNAETDIAQKP